MSQYLFWNFFLLYILYIYMKTWRFNSFLLITIHSLFLNKHGYLYVLVTFVRSLLSVNSKYTPCDPQNRIRSTMGQQKKRNVKTIFRVCLFHIFLIVTQIDFIEIELISHNTHLPTCYRKVRENAILFVFVSAIRFQTFPFTVIPQFQCVVQRCRQNVFAIRRKFNKRYWRIIIIYQCFQALSWRSIPNSTANYM